MATVRRCPIRPADVVRIARIAVGSPHCCFPATPPRGIPRPTRTSGEDGVATSFSEAISRQPIRAFSVATFVVCMLVLIADGMDAQLLGIVAPIVIEEFGVDRGTFGVAMGAALVGFGIGSWAGGWLGDTLGRRWSLALATVVFSLATIGASWSADVWQMAAWRLVGGLGFGSA